MNSSSPHSCLWLEDLSNERILRLFSQARQIKEDLKKGLNPSFLKGRQVVLFFSEPSTRTKLSFQMAAQRLGAQCLMIDNVKNSSMTKGESFADTFWALHSMGPDLLVVRCGEDEPLPELAMQTDIPMINAGFGSKAHPTQALLDAFTLEEHFGRLEGLKVLFVGDMDHSRVASSGIKLFQRFGAQVKICAPPALRQKREVESIDSFDSLDEAVQWCDVYVGLRVQFERHGDQLMDGAFQAEFVENYSLDAPRLGRLGSQAIIMHPGPVQWGLEFQACVQQDPRLRIGAQKENGVYTRGALMQELLRG